MNRKHPILLSLLLASLAQPVFAALKWDNREATVDAKLSDTEAKASFTFTNNGEQPITITSVKTSCGCTTAELAKDTYAPGESGTITASFNFGDRHGDQVKRIVVRTDNEQTPVTTLTFRVTIPEVLRVRPRLVYWRSGEDASPKTVQVEIVNDKPVRILAARIGVDASKSSASNDEETADEYSGGAFTAEVREVKKGKRYEIILTPKTVDKVINEPIRLVTDLPEEKQKDFKGFSVMARVLPGANGATKDSDEEHRQDGEHPQAKAD